MFLSSSENDFHYLFLKVKVIFDIKVTEKDSRNKKIKNFDFLFPNNNLSPQLGNELKIFNCSPSFYFFLPFLSPLFRPLPPPIQINIIFKLTTSLSKLLTKFRKYSIAAQFKALNERIALLLKKPSREEVG